MNSSPAQDEDLALELVGLSLDPVGDLLEPLSVELGAGQLHLAQEANDRELDVLEKVGEPAPADLLALPRGERVQQQRVGGGLVLDVCAEASLLGQLAERVGAPGGLEQVGRDLGVVGEGCGDLTKRFRIVGGDGTAPSASTTDSGRWPRP